MRAEPFSHVFRFWKLCDLLCTTGSLWILKAAVSNVLLSGCLWWLSGYRFHISDVRINRQYYFPRLYISHAPSTLCLRFINRLCLHNLRMQFFWYLFLCNQQLCRVHICFRNLKSYSGTTHYVSFSFIGFLFCTMAINPKSLRSS